MNEPTTFGALIARAANVCVRRLPLYAIATLIAFGLQAVLYFTRVLPVALRIDVPAFVISPILVLIVYVYAANDLGAADLAPGSLWERIFERAWAVILIDLVGSFVFQFAIGPFEDLGTMLIVQTAALVASALIIFGDVFAAVEPNVSPLMLVPKAFARSVILAIRPGNYWRALILVGLQIALSALIPQLDRLLVAKHVANVDFWALVPLNAITTVPIAALTIVFYFDCIARESAATRAPD
jgi:hypothetical protein